MEFNFKLEKRKITNIIFSFVSSICLLKYLQINWSGWKCLGIAIFMFMLFQSNSVNKIITKRKQDIVLLVFSMITSITLVLSAHIHVGTIYTGLKDVNYVIPYSLNDVIALIVLTIACLYFWKAVISLVILAGKRININNDITSKKIWLISSVGLFVAWIPYLLVYYPGYIFGDSLNSIWQIKGIVPWNNHHPLLYTFFIKICIEIGESIGNITFGCAIYTIIQMLYLAVALGYMIYWIRKKSMPKIFVGGTFCMFAFVPFYAQLSIVMWKDPIFSVTIAIWTLMLTDFIFSRGHVKNKLKFAVEHIVVTLMICFFRNNGIYIIISVECIILFVCFLIKNKFFIKRLRELVLYNAIVIIVIMIITGPIYSRLNLKGETVESFGVFLNQMARVVAMDGDMSTKDEEFMNNLLPLDMYSEKYYPCCIDLLKWDENFNEQYLEEHQKDFFITWFSMFVKNPICYFESWELMTIGYWGINQWEFNNDDKNITKGDLTVIDKVDNCGITPKNLLENKWIDFQKIFKYKDASINLALINWFVLFIMIVLIGKRKYSWLIILAPSLGNIATLLIASPYAYWQRYGLVEYYLAPVYVVIVIYALKKRKRKSTMKNERTEFDKKISI